MKESDLESLYKLLIAIKLYAYEIQFVGKYPEYPTDDGLEKLRGDCHAYLTDVYEAITERDDEDNEPSPAYEEIVLALTRHGLELVRIIIASYNGEYVGNWNEQLALFEAEQADI